MRACKGVWTACLAQVLPVTDPDQGSIRRRRSFRLCALRAMRPPATRDFKVVEGVRCLGVPSYFTRLDSLPRPTEHAGATQSMLPASRRVGKYYNIRSEGGKGSSYSIIHFIPTVAFPYRIAILILSFPRLPFGTSFGTLALLRFLDTGLVYFSIILICPT